MENCGKYGVWEINGIGEESATASLRDEVSLTVHQVENGILEGDWGEIGQRNYAVSGACLFGANWIVEFAKIGKDGGGAKRTLALPKERNDVYKKIKKGNKVSAVYLPQEPNAYHRLLIDWSMDRLSKLNPKRVLYHLPLWEYRQFIAEFEHRSGLGIPEAYNVLESFFQKTTALVEATASRYGIVLEFINPMRDFGITDPVESFGLPYFYPEKYGILPKDIFGVEDLVELKIALMAKERFNREIPMRLAVLAVPHPYFSRSGGDELPIYF
jgi:hypothetical protein